MDLSAAMEVDLKSGAAFRDTCSCRFAFDDFSRKHYPCALRIFSDGLVNPRSVATGCNSSIPASGVRFGVRLRDFASPMIAELYGIFYALKCTSSNVSAERITAYFKKVNLYR